MTDETRARFLGAIAAQLPADRIVEVHLFPAIRQGGMESGVAVLAVQREGETEVAPPSEIAVETQPLADAVDPFDDESPYMDGADESLEALDALEGDASPPPPARAVPRRYTVYSARYRHTLKGPDRGKWEVNVTEEADAPLLTIDAVVRGVQRRSGDAEEIVRLSGDETRALLPAPASP